MIMGPLEQIAPKRTHDHETSLGEGAGLIKDGHTCQVFERDADDTRKIGYYLQMNADGCATTCTRSCG